MAVIMDNASMDEPVDGTFASLKKGFGFCWKNSMSKMASGCGRPYCCKLSYKPAHHSVSTSTSTPSTSTYQREAHLSLVSESLVYLRDLIRFIGLHTHRKSGHTATGSAQLRWSPLSLFNMSIPADTEIPAPTIAMHLLTRPVRINFATPQRSGDPRTWVGCSCSGTASPLWQSFGASSIYMDYSFR